MGTNWQMQNRPIGVTGLMRVRNEEEYLEASIDSVIDALDELIICYHECSDQTPVILERKQKEYPEKIRVFHYTPHIYGHDLTLEEFDYVYNLPADSPHLLSTYYNYTLSKATYRYAVKIDADQIYFKVYFAKICDAYRSDKKYHFTFVEKFIASIFEGFMEGQLGWFKLYLGNLFIVSGLFGHIYEQYVLKWISNEKGFTWISGVNLCVSDGNYAVPLSYSKNGESRLIGLYNGEMNHCFFEVTEDTYYYPGKQFCTSDRSKPKGYSFIEAFHTGNISSSVFIGFLWYHMRWCKDENIKGGNLSTMPYSFLTKRSAEELQSENLFIVPNSCSWIFYFYHTCLLDYQLEKYGDLPDLRTK